MTASAFSPSRRRALAAVTRTSYSGFLYSSTAKLPFIVASSGPWTRVEYSKACGHGKLELIVNRARSAHCERLLVYGLLILILNLHRHLPARRNLVTRGSVHAQNATKVHRMARSIDRPV